MATELPGQIVRDSGAWRTWLHEHCAQPDGVWLVLAKKGTISPTLLRYDEALDEALCFGWIDGVRKTVDADRYTIRFTPRQPRSTWSAVNIQRAGELLALGRMQPAGQAAFAARREDRSRQYSYENKPRQLDAPYEEQFQAHPAAWEFFRAQPPGYQRTAAWWVLSAKQEATRLRRLALLIDGSAQGQRLAAVVGAAKGS